MTALKERQADPARYTLTQFPDGSCDLLTADEVEFLDAYREADAEDKRRFDRALRHMKAGEAHPTAAEFASMSPEAVRAWMDALPEPQT